MRPPPRCRPLKTRRRGRGMITALLYFGGVRPVQATGRVGAKHKGGVALRGSGEARSGWNLCDSLPACPSARSGWGLHQDHGFPRGASPPGTRGARSVSPEPGGGGGAATSRGRPRHEQPGGDARRPGPRASGGSRPRTPCSPPSRRAATPRPEPEREQLVAGAGRGVGQDWPCKALRKLWRGSEVQMGQASLWLR